jgi:hypothetical protein
MSNAGVHNKRRGVSPAFTGDTPLCNKCHGTSGHMCHGTSGHMCHGITLFAEPGQL